MLKKNNTVFVPFKQHQRVQEMQWRRGSVPAVCRMQSGRYLFWDSDSVEDPNHHPHDYAWGGALLLHIREDEELLEEHCDKGPAQCTGHAVYGEEPRQRCDPELQSQSHWEICLP